MEPEATELKAKQAAGLGKEREGKGDEEKVSDAMSLSYLSNRIVECPHSEVSNQLH